MNSAFSSILPILVSVAFLMLGNGALGTLIGIRLSLAGAGPVAVGIVGAAYFAGLTVGSMQCFRLISRVGHIRAFAAFASVFSAASLGHAIVADVWLWTALRFLEGLCLAGIYMCVESWLNDQASNETRGRILSLYMVTLYAALGAGQQLLNLEADPGALLFMVISILVSISLVPVSLTRTAPPMLPDVTSFSLRKLYRASPLGLAGVFISGTMTGALYSLGPVFGATSGFGVSGTAAFMTVLILGGVLLQWPLGRLSDILDRRTVIIAVAAVLGAASLGLWATPAAEQWRFLAFALFFGGLSFSLYPLSLAHTNDYVAKSDLVAASGGLILLNSVGAILGPLAGSVAMSLIGPSGLFVFSAVMALGAAGFGIARTFARPSLPAEAQAAFQPLPQTTPVAAPLHPEHEDAPAA